MKIKYLIILALLACGCYRTEYGQVIASDGIVNKQFVPSYTVPTMETMDVGDITIFVPSSEEVPAQYIVKIYCSKHGEYSYDNQKLYNQFGEGEKVTVYCQEAVRKWKHKTNEFWIYKNVGKYIPEGTVEK